MVVERAAILAEADFAAVMTWIGAHDGKLVEAAVATGSRGEASWLPTHRERGSKAPLRFVLPASAVG